MTRLRVGTIVDLVAAAALVGVLITLVLLVDGAATWSVRGAPAPPAGEVRTCTNDDLVLAVDDVADDPADARRTLALTWRNESATPCGSDGFPIVDLVGPTPPRFGLSRFGSVVNAPRDDAEPRETTLGPGETARSLLRWVPVGARPSGPDAEVWTPDRIVVATPGEARNQSVAWRYGPVLVAGGGRVRPGVSFGPLTSG